MNKAFATTIAWGLGLAVSAAATDAEPESGRQAFVRSLLGRMTLEEKIGQLNLPSVGLDVTGPVVSADVEAKIRRGEAGGVFNAYTPAVTRKLQDLAVKETRLGIPLLFGYDVIHGHKTIFPIPLGLSCSWDPTLIQRSARLAAVEAAADGLNWVFSPMVDIARDPRWGRIAEGSGEDPFLGSTMAAAMVRGYQGDDLARSNTVLACVKHFALYGAAEGGRDYNTVDMSRLKMFEYYLPPYQAAVAAGAGSVMTSFNEVDAIPASGNRWLVTDLLRGQWGFRGLVVSDYTSINEMVAHGTGELKQNVQLALKAGVDMDMVGEGYLRYAKALIAEGALPESVIEAACARVLTAKHQLGLFADPYRGCTEGRAREEIFTPAHRAAAREFAERSCVLLKNANETLPLKTTGVIALVGPLADRRRDLIGSWSAAGDWKQAVSVEEGIRNAAGPGLTILRARGANLIEEGALREALNASGGELEIDSRSREALVEEAVAVAGRAEVVVVVLGEAFGMSGEAASRSDIGLPEHQQELLRALVALGKPVVLVLMNGRPLTLTWEDAHCQAILETWFAGTEAGNAIAALLFGSANPSGKLTASFPRAVGQIPVYYNHKNTGRPYRGDPREKYLSRYLDIPNEPLYPFGYGLSYTTFECDPPRLSKTVLRGNDSLTATVKVSNTGRHPGRETVQLYITDPVASLTRSVLDLRGFQQVELRPGETREVVFTITPEQLKFFNRSLHYDWEPGEFIIRTGPDSAHLKSASVRWERP